MSLSKKGILKIVNHVISVLIALLFLFVSFELFLPVNSKAQLFKSAYGVEYSLNETTPPKNFVFEPANYNVKSGKYIFVKFNIDGEENCCQQVSCWSENENIALCYSTSFGEVMVTGVKSGTTKIHVASAVDNKITRSFFVNVSDFETLSYSGLEVIGPCYTLENKLIYQESTSIQYGQNLKLNYVVKNDAFVVVPSKLNYEIDGGPSNCVDSDGNFISSAECIGKTIKIRISSSLSAEYNLQPIEYTVRVENPSGYGGVYIKKYTNAFFIYSISFMVVGLMAGVVSNYLGTKHIRVALVGSLIFTAIMSYVILFLHAFALARPFLWIYWIVSPIIAGLGNILVNEISRKKIFDFVKGVFNGR